MSTQETFDALKAKYPGRKVSAWNWIPENGRQRFSIDVDSASCHEDSFEACMENIKVKSLTDEASEKKAAAQKLIDEANGLLAQASQLTAAVEAGA